MIIRLAKHPEFSARMAAEQCFGITCDSTEISALTIYGVGFGNRKTAVSRKGECAKSGEIRDGGGCARPRGARFVRYGLIGLTRVGANHGADHRSKVDRRRQRLGRGDAVLAVVDVERSESLRSGDFISRPANPY